MTESSQSGATPRIAFEREAYLRDDKSLTEFERELILRANDYETAFATGNIYKNTRSCVSFQRRCYYFDLCQRHGEMTDGEFRTRPSDYVDLEYYNLLGVPAPPEMEANVISQDLQDAG